MTARSLPVLVLARALALVALLAGGGATAQEGGINAAIGEAAPAPREAYPVTEAAVSAVRIILGRPLPGETCREALFEDPELFVTTFIEKMTTYALGRGVRGADMPVVREIRRNAAANDYRFSSIVLGIVDSVPFRMRRAPEEDGNALSVAIAEQTL